jgi:hypothetical protein
MVVKLLLAFAFAAVVFPAAVSPARSLASPLTRSLRRPALVHHRGLVDVGTYHGDNLRTGWNRRETVLTTANVATASFGQLFSVPMDGLTFMQPLVASNESVPNQGVHNLLIAGTNHDTLFAYDADTGAPVWQTTFINPSAGVTTVPLSFTGCDNVGQEDGLLSTPVIDRSTDTLYVVAATLEGVPSAPHIHFRLHALSLATGIDKMPASDIAGSFAGPHKTAFVFDPDVQFQRAGLLESRGNIYVAFGGQCDFNPTLYHGWLFAFAANTLAQTGIINVSPVADPRGDYYGGIWMSGYGLAADPQGNVYFAVGNGTFDGGVYSFGESILRVPQLLHRNKASFFTPYTVFSDNSNDADTGSGGVMLLPPQPGTYPHLAVMQGKDGVLTLLNRDNLGGYVAGGPDNALSELTLGPVFGGPAFWQDAAGNAYVFTTGGPLYAVKVASGSLTVTSQSTVLFPSDNGNGSTPSVSSRAQVAGTAIVWVVQRPSNVQTDTMYLYAFAAANLGSQLFQGSLGMWPQSDLNPTLVPTIANGKVYVPTANSIAVFGLH